MEGELDGVEAQLFSLLAFVGFDRVAEERELLRQLGPLLLILLDDLLQAAGEGVVVGGVVVWKLSSWERLSVSPMVKAGWLELPLPLPLARRVAPPLPLPLLVVVAERPAVSLPSARAMEPPAPGPCGSAPSPPTAHGRPHGPPGSPPPRSPGAAPPGPPGCPGCRHRPAAAPGGCCPGRWPLRDNRPLATGRVGVRRNIPEGQALRRVWRCGVLPGCFARRSGACWLQRTPWRRGWSWRRSGRCEGQGLARHSFQLELIHQLVELSGIQGLRCLCWDGLDPLSESQAAANALDLITS